MPGLIFLLVYQIFAMAYTGYVAFTNYGDGHNSTKEDAVAAVLAQNEVRVEGDRELPAERGAGRWDARVRHRARRDGGGRHGGRAVRRPSPTRR